MNLNDHTSICDAPHSRDLIETVTSEIDKVHDIVLIDQRVKVCKLVEATDIPHDTVISILYEQLGMKKLSARWTLRLLTVDQACCTISKQCLEMFQSRWISASIHYCGWNIDTLFHPRRRDSQNNGFHHVNQLRRR